MVGAAATPDQVAWSAHKRNGSWVEQAVAIRQVMNVAALAAADLTAALVVFPHRTPKEFPLIRLQEVLVVHAIIYARRRLSDAGFPTALITATLGYQHLVEQPSEPGDLGEGAAELGGEGRVEQRSATVGTASGGKLKQKMV